MLVFPEAQKLELCTWREIKDRIIESVHLEGIMSNTHLEVKIGSYAHITQSSKTRFFFFLTVFSRYFYALLLAHRCALVCTPACEYARINVIKYAPTLYERITTLVTTKLHLYCPPNPSEPPPDQKDSIFQEFVGVGNQIRSYYKRHALAFTYHHEHTPTHIQACTCIHLRACKRTYTAQSVIFYQLLFLYF